MKKILYIVLFFFVPVYGHSSHEWLLRNCSGDGTWHSPSGRDCIVSLLAMKELERCSDERCISAAADCNAVLRSSVDAGLYAALARAVCSDDSSFLESYAGHGFSNEPGAFPDLLSTLWCCYFLNGVAGVSDNWLNESGEFISGEALDDGSWGISGEGSIRLSLFSVFVLMNIYDDLLLSGDFFSDASDVENYDIVELSYCLPCMAFAGEWDIALKIRNKLLEARNPNGGWPERPGMGSDILTTCLALSALNVFSVKDQNEYADLDLPSDGISFSGGIVSCIVFNNGMCAAVPYLMRAVFKDINGIKISECVIEAGRLERGHCEKFSFKVPSGASACFIYADMECVTGDCRMSNNAAVFEINGTSPEGLELFPILAAGDSLEEPIFLAPGRGIELTSALLKYGLPGDALVTLSDNGRIAFSGRFSGDISIEWFPDEGMHRLELKAVCGDFECITGGDVEVVHGGAVIRTRSIEQQPSVLCDSFGAREYVEFEVVTSCDDIETEVTVYDSSGDMAGVAVPCPGRRGRWQWHTMDFPPGEYRAKAVLRDASAHFIVSDAECVFTIVPNVTLEDLAVAVPGARKKIYQGQEWESEMDFSWKSRANISSSCRIAWILQDIEGRGLEWGEGGMEHELNTSLFLQAVRGPVLKGIFSAAGSYRLMVRLTSEFAELECSVPVQVMPAPSVVLKSSVAPDLVDTGINVIKATISLTGEVDIAKEEVISFRCAAEPVFAVNDSSIPVLIRLTDLADANGNAVESGSLVCSVMHGRLDGGVSLSDEKRMDGDIMRFDIGVSGIEVLYIPSGKRTAFKMTPVYMEVRNSLTSEAIGTVGIFLMNEEVE